ncbi:hypothetical protein [Streptomyces sp. NPDC001292]
MPSLLRPIGGTPPLSGTSAGPMTAAFQRSTQVRPAAQVTTPVWAMYL